MRYPPRQIKSVANAVQTGFSPDHSLVTYTEASARSVAMSTRWKIAHETKTFYAVVTGSVRPKIRGYSDAAEHEDAALIVFRLDAPMHKLRPGGIQPTKPKCLVISNQARDWQRIKAQQPRSNQRRHVPNQWLDKYSLSKSMDGTNGIGAFRDKSQHVPDDAPRQSTSQKPQTPSLTGHLHTTTNQSGVYTPDPFVFSPTTLLLTFS